MGRRGRAGIRFVYRHGSEDRVCVSACEGEIGREDAGRGDDAALDDASGTGRSGRGVAVDPKEGVGRGGMEGENGYDWYWRRTRVVVGRRDRVAGIQEVEEDASIIHRALEIYNVAITLPDSRSAPSAVYIREGAFVEASC